MPERRIEEIQQLKTSAEKRKINKEKQNIQMSLMKKMNFFSNQIGEAVEQNNKPRKKKKYLLKNPKIQEE